MNILKIGLLLFPLLVLQTVEAYRSACYFASWSVWRDGLAKYSIDNIDPWLCTHVIFAFIFVNADGTVRWEDANFFSQLQALKSKNPDVKLMVAVGGATQGQYEFGVIVKNPQLRQNFVDSAVSFLQRFQFDGFDLDWEYPASSEKAGFSLLLSELRQRFDQENYLLSAAVTNNGYNIDTSYDVPTLSRDLDFINIMAYDFDGAWSPRTGHNAGLHPGSVGDRMYNVQELVKQWIQKGAEPEKLNLGLPSYGRTFRLTSSAVNVGAPASGPGEPSRFTRESGTLPYNEICYEQKQNLWTNYRDTQQGVPYAVKGQNWLSFDDELSIIEKVDFLKQQGLGGVMIWTVDTDDFSNICGNGKYPILSAAVSELGGLNFGGSTVTRPPQPSSSSTQSTTVSVPTSTQATTTPNGDSSPSEKCTTDGQLLPDPTDCSKFYQCQRVSANQYIVHSMKCQSDLVFDSSASVCNYRALVQC